MQVVILAAGRGARLGARAEGLPKCLLQVGGEPLLERQLRILAEAGASPVLAVVGYAADLVRDALRDRAETILNPRYATTNSLYSLWLAREWIQGPVLVMNSDVLFDRELVELLLKAGPDHLAYDSSSGRAPEHMKVRFEEGRVADLSKALPREQSGGENVGLVYLGGSTARRVLEKAGELVARNGENLFWAEALRRVLGETPVRGVDVAGVPWIEIDCPYDLDRARREVWPSIRDRSGPSAPLSRRSRWPRLAMGALFLLAMFIGLWSMAASTTTASWEPLSPAGGRRAAITVAGNAQDWTETSKGESVSVAVAGPRALRIDLRALVPKGSAETVPYAVAVAVDGKRELLDSFTGRPKDTVEHGRASVCDRDKIHFKVPAGRHVIAVTQEAGDLAGLLLRFRILDDQE
jgi:choline kinase